MNDSPATLAAMAPPRSPAVDVDNVLHPEFLANPYPVYDQLRAADPVHWNEQLQAWLLVRYGDVRRAVFDYEAFSSARTSAFLTHLTAEVEEPFPVFARVRRRILFYTDPPQHTRLRRPIQTGLPKTMVAQMRPRIEQVVRDLLAGAEHRRTIELIGEFALRLPVAINTELIGIPSVDRDQAKQWSSRFIAAINASGAAADADIMRDGEEAVIAMMDYFQHIARQRCERPAEDLITTLVSQVDGVPDIEDIAATCIALLFASLETVGSLIGNGSLALLRNPDQLALLTRQPEIPSEAIEELLRYDTAVQMVGRMATADLELAGKEIRRHDRILPIIGAANRDPSQFEDPNRLNLARHPNPHLSFSSGRHYCPGSELARLEGEVAFTALLPLLERAELAEREIAWQPNITFRVPSELTLLFS